MRRMPASQFYPSTRHRSTSGPLWREPGSAATTRPRLRGHPSGRRVLRSRGRHARRPVRAGQARLDLGAGLVRARDREYAGLRGPALGRRRPLGPAADRVAHIPLYVRRGLYSQSLGRLWHVFQEFMQALFIAPRTYPIAYNKWVREQVEDSLGLPGSIPTSRTFSRSGGWKARSWSGRPRSSKSSWRHTPEKHVGCHMRGSRAGLWMAGTPRSGSTCPPSPRIADSRRGRSAGPYHETVLASRLLAGTGGYPAN